MKIMDLSKELGITNKDLIAFLRENNISASSHMQTATDEMINIARENFATKKEEKTEVVTKKTTKEIVKNDIPEFIPKKFMPDDTIPCRSVTPWKIVTIGADGRTVYRWDGFGDIEYVSFRDLQFLKRKDLIKEAQVIIEDENLCFQWKRELGETYKKFLSVEYPEEFFDLNDDDFKELLITAPNTLKETIKYTAFNMIKNENYPTLNKIIIVDEVLGTCIKEFL